MPAQHRFNRHRALMNACHLIRQCGLRLLDLSADGQCAIDRWPVPVVKWHRVPGSTGDWGAHGADFGKVASKHVTMFGFRLHWLVSLGGLLLDFALAPTSAADLTVGAELLAEQTDWTVFGDTAYSRVTLTRHLLVHNRLKLITLPRRHQTQSLPEALSRTVHAARPIIETVNGQLMEQFNIQLNHAPSFGPCVRACCLNSPLIPYVSAFIVYSATLISGTSRR